MRIRKHARISAVPSSSPSTIALEAPDTRVCLLNRSPWDVIACTPQSEHEYQVKMDDNDHMYRNSIGGEPVRAPNSTFASLAQQYWEGVANKSKKEEVEEERNLAKIQVVNEKAKKKAKIKREFDYIACAKTDGKGWFCKKEAKQGEVLCEHHLIQLEFYHQKYSAANSYRKDKQVKQAVVKAVAAKRKTNRSRVAASPADFYFYSGFGPSWGKKRGGNKIKTEQMEEVLDDRDETQSNSSSQTHVPQVRDQASSSTQVHVPQDQDQDRDNDHIYDEFDDYEDDDDDEEDNGGKKRIRRPIKARSLKSLL